MLFDLTRGRAAGPQDFLKSRMIKEEAYKDLVEDLRAQGQEVEFFALPVSYDAAIDVSSWEAAMGPIFEISGAGLNRLLEICSRQLILGIDTMVEARNLARKLVRTGGLHTDGRKP